MAGGDIIISADALIRVLIVLLYGSLCPLAFRLLFSRLAPAPRRLAVFMLAAQIFVIIAALLIQPASDFEAWLWDFESEWNVPATLASTQFALVAGVSLMTAWLAREQPLVQRLYYLGIGLLFIFLALDEYFLLHERIDNWRRVYAALGAAVFAATLLATARAPRREWLLRLCLLAGLAIAATGAMVFNFLPQTCVELAFARVSGCLEFLFLGEALELLGVWLALAAALAAFSMLARLGRRRVQLALYSLPALWILLLIHDPLLLRFELRFLAEPTAIVAAPATRIHGYRMDLRADEIAFQLYASTRHREFIGLGYSIHLIDQVTGASIASSDKYAGAQLRFKLDSDFVHVYRQRMTLPLPPQAPRQRALWAVLTLWRKQGDAFPREKILESDRRRLSDTQVVLDELVLPVESPAPKSPPRATFENGFALEAATLPQGLRPGQTASIGFTWRAEKASREDFTQFLHFIHADSGARWGHDQQPLGPRLPTRLWYSGMVESETWEVALPDDMAPGPYDVFTGLYRLSDMARLPARDAEAMPFAEALVPLGVLLLES